MVAAAAAMSLNENLVQNQVSLDGIVENTIDTDVSKERTFKLKCFHCRVSVVSSTKSSTEIFLTRFLFNSFYHRVLLTNRLSISRLAV